MQSQLLPSVKLLPFCEDAPTEYSVGLGEAERLGHWLCAHRVMLVSASFSAHLLVHALPWECHGLILSKQKREFETLVRFQ